MNLHLSPIHEGGIISFISADPSLGSLRFQIFYVARLARPYELIGRIWRHRRTGLFGEWQ